MFAIHLILHNNLTFVTPDGIVILVGDAPSKKLEGTILMLL